MAASPKQTRAARDQRLDPPPPMRLTERDLNILQAVYECRLLTTDHLETLFFPSMHQAYDRLHKLYHNAYLDRVMHGAHADKMNTPMLYILDKRGVELLRRERGIEAEWNKRLKQTTPTFLEHALAINTVRVAVTKAAQDQGFKLVKWLGENDLKASYDYVMIRTASGRMKRVSVIPDSYFVLETPRGTAHFFLEVDRGTETLGVIKTKVAAYQNYYQSGGYERRYNTKSLRVLLVTSSFARLANLRRTTEESEGKQRYWFSILETLTPESIFTASVWQIATKEGRYPLIDVSV